VSEEYSQVIRRLASDCISSGLVEEAAILASKLIENLERTGGDTNPDYAFAVTVLAYVYQKRGQLAEAESQYVKSLRLRAWHFGKPPSLFRLGVFNLAVIYMIQGRMLPARRSLERVLQTHERGECADELLYARTLRELAVLSEEGGDLQHAREFTAKSLDLFARLRGADHPDTRRVRDQHNRLEKRRDPTAAIE